jgi:FAD-linked sulfhydryl oxidase
MMRRNTPIAAERQNNLYANGQYMVGCNTLEKNGWKWPRDIPKNIWAHKGWEWLHTVAINYPQKPTDLDARQTFRRIWNFIDNLPCEECRRHAASYTIQNIPNLTSTHTLQRWAWAFHNSVNKRIGNPQFSYESYRNKYFDEILRSNVKKSSYRI